MAKMQSINPATEEVMKEYECLTTGQATEELEKSRKAWEKWKKTPVKKRVEPLKKLAGLMKAHSRKYGEIMSKEMGKPIKQAIAEAEKCAWACEYYAENAKKFLKDRKIKTEASKSFVAFQPLGVILGIMPWNFPFWQVFRFAVPAITAGNVAVLKHSSNVPQCAIEIEKVFREAGYPEYVFKTLLITGSQTQELIDGDSVDGISLTGSTEAGKKVGEAAGKNIKKLVLELGGSDPFVVLPDADMQFACEAAATARFQNSGQSCIAAKRFIVHKDIAEEFKKKFVEFTRAQKTGDPMDENTNIGPLARNDLRDALEDQLKRALEQGAKLMTGGRKPEGRGYFFEPTIIEVPKDAPILQEETFGPLAAVIVCENEKEMIEIANSTQYGLGASVWSRDVKKAEKIARQIDAGFVAINGMVKSDPRLPFGGIKKSGVGRELSEFGIREFVNIKTIVMQ